MPTCSRLSNATIIRSTDKALLVTSHRLNWKEVWIPKVCATTFRNDDLKTWDIYLPLWLGRKIGLNVN